MKKKLVVDDLRKMRERKMRDKMRDLAYRNLGFRDGFTSGVRAAADEADKYNSTSSHPHRLGDCILAKLNPRKRVPRKNPGAAVQDGAFYQGAALVIASIARRGGQSFAKDLMRDNGFTLETLVKARIDRYDLDVIRKVMKR